VALASNSWIRPDDLFPNAAYTPGSSDDLPTLSEVRESAERHYIRLALERVKGRVDEAAWSLAIDAL